MLRGFPNCSFFVHGSCFVRVIKKKKKITWSRSTTNDVVVLLGSPGVFGPADRGHDDNTVANLVLGRVALDLCDSANTICSQDRVEHNDLNKKKKQQEQTQISNQWVGTNRIKITDPQL